MKKGDIKTHVKGNKPIIEMQSEIFPLVGFDTSTGGLEVMHMFSQPSEIYIGKISQN